MIDRILEWQDVHPIWTLVASIIASIVLGYGFAYGMKFFADWWRTCS